MKHYRLFKIVFVISVLCGILFLAACSPTEEESPSVETVNITIGINYPKISKVPDLAEDPFRVEEDTSVLEVIELYGTVNDIPVLIETTNGTLEGINDVQNDMYEKGYGWRCKINGEYQKKDFNKLIVEDGDLVEFVYVSTK